MQKKTKSLKNSLLDFAKYLADNNAEVKLLPHQRRFIHYLAKKNKKPLDNKKKVK